MTEEKQTPETRETNWGPIFKDILILMCVMGMLGYICNLLMKPFETITPVDSLVSLIRKGDVRVDKDGQLADAPFVKELKGVISDSEHAPQGINTQDNTGRTALMWAVYANYNRPQIETFDSGEQYNDKDLSRLYYVRTLLATPGMNPHERDEDGFTALHWAAWSGMPWCAFTLVQAGLDINAQENNGYTPLMLAAMRGNADTVEMLLKLGADRELKNAKGETATSLASSAAESYHKRDTFTYTLIFSDLRDAYYQKTVSDLSEVTPTPAPAELHAQLQTLQGKYTALLAKTPGSAASAATEEKEEDQVEAAAAAPPQSSPEQAPSQLVD